MRFWEAFGLATLLVFVAEFGDKSQLFAFTLGARYRTGPVLAALGLAILVLQAVAVLVGVLLDAALPTRPITAIAGLAFIGFAVWTILSGRADPYDEPQALDEAPRGALLGAVGAFVLSEIGDKTMLAAAALAARQNAVATWAGASTGMFIADGMAAWLGSAVGSRLNRRLMRALSAALFAAIGVILVVEAARGSG